MHQHLVVKYAVILDVCLRREGVEIVIAAAKPRNIDPSTAGLT